MTGPSMAAPKEYEKAHTFSAMCQGQPDVILIGTGSELQLAVEAQEKLASEGIKARVVSMPCWDLFDAQSAEYKESVLPSAVRARVAVEAGTPIGWERYVDWVEGRGAKAIRRLRSG